MPLRPRVSVYLQVAAGEVLLEQAHQEEAEQPDCPVTENVAAVEQAVIDDQQSGLPQRDDKQRKTSNTPAQTGQKVLWEFRPAPEAIDRVGAPLDLRHDPGNEEDNQKGDERAAQRTRSGQFRASGLRRLCSGRMEFVTNDVCTEDQGSKKSDENEQAPSRPQSVLPHEDLVEGRRLRRNNKE
jgi:hypothetical protein